MDGTRESLLRSASRGTAPPVLISTPFAAPRIISTGSFILAVPFAHTCSTHSHRRYRLCIRDVVPLRAGSFASSLITNVHSNLRDLASQVIQLNEASTCV